MKLCSQIDHGYYSDHPAVLKSCKPFEMTTPDFPKDPKDTKINDWHLISHVTHVERRDAKSPIAALSALPYSNATARVTQEQPGRSQTRHGRSH